LLGQSDNHHDDEGKSFKSMNKLAGSRGLGRLLLHQMHLLQPTMMQSLFAALLDCCPKRRMP
jgi:hypothetical protein